jgi:hypothetical protein
MNTHEQRIKEFAYQIWESEGCPSGHDSRHWEMACKLAGADDENYEEEKVTGNIQSTIAPEEPFDPNPQPEIDPAPPQPDQAPPPAHPNIPPRPSTPAEPIAPVVNPPHISPTPTSDPIHPTDPVQPGNPSQPIQPYASKHTAQQTKSALKKDGVEPVAPKKQTKAKTKSTKTTKQQDSIQL